MSEPSTAGAAKNVPNSNGQPVPAGGPADAAQDTSIYSQQATRGLIFVTAAACFALFWLIGGWLRIPLVRGFEASLFQQPAATCALALVVGALLLGGCAVAGHFIAGRRWLFAGPFVAACGLGAWSCRGGPSRYVYFHAAAVGDGRAVFLVLALELAVLALFVGAIWYFIATRGRALALASQGDSGTGDSGAGNSSIGATATPNGLTRLRLQAIAAQVLMTALLILCITPIDAKKQVLASMFLATFIAASLTEYAFANAELDAWFWVAPALTGIAGYLLNYFTNAVGAPDITGHLTGMLAPLSRPLPLDYASAGMVGALLGFWTGGEHPEIAVGMQLFRPRMTLRGIRPQARAAR